MSQDKDLKLTAEQFAANVEELYNKLHAKAADLVGKVDLNNIVVLTDQAMKEMAELHLAGMEKKRVVVAAVHKFVDETVQKMREEAEEVTEDLEKAFLHLKVMADKALDPMVDQLYALAPHLYKAAEHVESRFKRFKQSVKDAFKKLGNKLRCH